MRTGTPRLVARALAASNVSGCATAAFCSAEREQPLVANASANAANVSTSFAIGSTGGRRNRSVMESSPPTTWVHFQAQESHGSLAFTNSHCAFGVISSAMRGSRVVITRVGGPEVLKVQEFEASPPRS